MEDYIEIEYIWGGGMEFDTVTVRDTATRRILVQGYGWNMIQALQDAIRLLSFHFFGDESKKPS